MSVNLNANIDINKTGVPLKRCDHTGVKYDIEISCTCIVHPMHYRKFSMSTLQIWACLSSVFWKNYSFTMNMVRRRISEAQKWQIIGMRSTGISFKAIGRQIGYHYTIVSRPVRKHTQTNTVKDLPRYRRPHVTSQREDRALHRLIRWMSFATSPVLKRQWLPNRRVQQEQWGTVWNQQDWSQGD
jgi:hypothetical protein